MKLFTSLLFVIWQGAALAVSEPITIRQNIQDKAISTTIKQSLGFGYPDLMSYRLSKKIGRSNDVGLGFGLIPAGFLLPDLQTTHESEISPLYQIGVEPDANIFTSSLAWDLWMNESRSGSFFSFQYTLFILNGSGRAALINKETRQSVSLATLDVTFYNSLLGASYGYRFQSKPNKSSLELGVGLIFSLSSAIKSSLRGTQAAFLNTAPEYREAFVDGSKDFEKDMTKALKEMPFVSKIMPLIYLRKSW